MKIKSQTFDKIATICFYILTSGVVLLFLALVSYILCKGSSRLNIHFLTTPSSFSEAGGGIVWQLFNSIYLVFLSMLITVPIGLLAGIYMAEYAKKSKLTDIIRFSIETLASLPSIVIGLFGFLVFVKLTGWNYTLMGGALAVSVLNLPVMTRICEDAFASLPKTLREASLALGASKWQTITKILIPAAFPGIITGIIITSGRVFGEAAALLYTSGMSTPEMSFTNLNIFDTNSPLNPFRPAETLAVYIWKVNSEGLVPDARQVADGASAILIIFVFAFNIFARILERIIRNKTTGE